MKKRIAAAVILGVILIGALTTLYPVDKFPLPSVGLSVPTVVDEEDSSVAPMRGVSLPTTHPEASAFREIRADPGEPDEEDALTEHSSSLAPDITLTAAVHQVALSFETPRPDYLGHLLIVSRILATITAKDVTLGEDGITSVRFGGGLGFLTYDGSYYVLQVPLAMGMNVPYLVEPRLSFRLLADGPGVEHIRGIKGWVGYSIEDAPGARRYFEVLEESQTPSLYSYELDPYGDWFWVEVIFIGIGDDNRFVEYAGYDRSAYPQPAHIPDDLLRGLMDSLAVVRAVAESRDRSR